MGWLVMYIFLPMPTVSRHSWTLASWTPPGYQATDLMETGGALLRAKHDRARRDLRCHLAHFTDAETSQERAKDQPTQGYRAP